MKVGATLFVVLGAFVLGAGIVYGLWGHEPAGTFYLTVLGVAFMYLAYVLRQAAPTESRDTEEEHPAGAGHAGTGSAADFEPQPIVAHASAPSITPFFFAIAIALVVLGLVFNAILAVLAAAATAVVVVAWFIETGSRREAEHAAARHAAEALKEPPAASREDSGGGPSDAAE